MKAHSSRNAKLKKTVYTTVVFAVIIFAGMMLPRIFSLVSSVVMTPVHHINQWFITSDQMLPVLLRDRKDLLDEIKTLESELLATKGEGLTIQRLQDENQRLRNLMGVEPGERTVARVLARPGSMPYDLLQIDQGSRVGIVENALVYSGRDQLIGIVSFVSADYSLVTLFTSPGSEMTGFIAGPDVIATIEGVGGGVARVRVPQGVPLSVGNIVYVPSVQPGVFGRLSYIESRPSQPEQYGYITLPVSLRSLHEVALTKKPVEQASVEAVLKGKAMIQNQLLLAEEANTVSFEELLSTSTPTTTEENSDEI